MILPRFRPAVAALARIDSFDVVNDHRTGPGGRPAQVGQVQKMSGSQLGQQGQTRIETSFTPLR